MAEAEVYGGRYRLIEPIGEGGSSIVWRALDEQLGLEVALKVVEGDPNRSETLRARLRTEAETMMRLSHPNILQIHAVGPEANWFAMALSPEGSIADQVGNNGPLAPQQAIRVVLQLLGALEVAHGAGVVHRDVKPENLLRQRDGSIKLCDFGIALVEDQTRVTRAGFAMGSLPYMSPEQRVDPATVGPAADLYSVGATLYHLITASTPVDLFLAPPSSPRFAGIPEGLVELIRKATAADPQDRFGSAVEMREALERCLASAAAEPLDRPETPVATGRVRTAVVDTQSDEGGVARLEAELHRAWREEEERKRRTSAAINKRLALVVAFMMFVLVMAGAGAFALEDWLDAQRRTRVFEEAEIVGDWTGTFGTAASTLSLRGSHGALAGTLTIAGREDRHIAGAVTGGWLVLVDQTGQGLSGQYRATLADGGRLDGEYVTREGRWPFHFVREL